MAQGALDIVTLVTFVATIFLTINPIHVPIPKGVATAGAKTLVIARILSIHEERAYALKLRRLPLSLETAPPIAVLFLLATTAVDGSTIRLGIAGEHGVRPYNVLVLFISLAYIAISLDTTGLLRALAFYVAEKRGKNKARSGISLHITLYAFFFAFAVVVGNDPVILSGTAFLAYLTRVTGLDPPLAWTLSEFIAANTASAVLVPSNPTNVLVASGFKLNFLTGFTKYTVLPSVIPAILLYPVLLFMFKRAHPQSIPKVVVPPDVDPRAALVDPSGAVFHSILMLVTLGVLVGTSFVPNEAVGVWMVTLPAGVIALLRDVTVDYRRGLGLPSRPGQSPPASPELEQDASHDLEIDLPAPQHAFPPSTVKRDPKTFSSLMRGLSHCFPSTSTTLSRLPVPILPFAMGMFILVRALGQHGWIDIVARGFARACTSPATTVFFIGYMTVILCPFCGTNIGTTILFVEILRTPHFAQKDEQTMRAAIYALAMGSNLGAFSVTFTGSLAGLLWRGLLKQKGIIVSSRDFAVFNLVPVMFTTTLACAIVLAEIHWFT